MRKDRPTDKRTNQQTNKIMQYLEDMLKLSTSQLISHAWWQRLSTPSLSRVGPLGGPTSNLLTNIKVGDLTTNYAVLLIEFYKHRAVSIVLVAYPDPECRILIIPLHHIQKVFYSLSNSVCGVGVFNAHVISIIWKGRVSYKYGKTLVMQTGIIHWFYMHDHALAVLTSWHVTCDKNSSWVSSDQNNFVLVFFSLKERNDRVVNMIYSRF